MRSSFFRVAPQIVQGRKNHKAIRRAYRDILDDPEAAADALVKGRYYQVGRDVIVAAMKTLPGEVILRPNMEGVGVAIEDLVEQGYMQPVTTEIYDSSFLDAIDQLK